VLDLLVVFTVSQILAWRLHYADFDKNLCNVCRKTEIALISLGFFAVRKPAIFGKTED